MIRYTSFMKPMIDDFIKYQTASQCHQKSFKQNTYGKDNNWLFVCYLENLFIFGFGLDFDEYYWH